jgi:hypothetical protein
MNETSVTKAKKARLPSPPSGVLRRIGAVADEERSGTQFDRLPAEIGGRLLATLGLQSFTMANPATQPSQSYTSLT